MDLGPQFRHIKAGDLANPEKFDYYDLGKGSEARTFDDMWANKVRSAKRSPESGGDAEDIGPGETSLYESIRKNGVRTPINVVEGESDLPMITEGHHRVFSAADINPDMRVPVWWDNGRNYSH